MNKLIFLLFLTFYAGIAYSQQKNVKITVLYNNYVFAEGTEADWGFAALVETADKTILFDTGTKPAILMKNCEKMNVDFSAIDAVVISHNHLDHTGGLFTALKKTGEVTVYMPAGTPDFFLTNITKLGSHLEESEKVKKIGEGLYLSGTMGSAIKEQALVIQSDKGTILLTGCAHPGIAEMAHTVRDNFKSDIYCILGGFHLMETPEDGINNIIADFRKMKVVKCGATHCTGDKAIAMFKKKFGDNYMQMGTGNILNF